MFPTLAVLLSALFSMALPVVTPKDDLVITESCRLKPGTYRIADAGEPGVIRIEGEHLTVILDGVVLDGAAEGAKPDTFTGTGVIVRGKANIVHGGTVRGFKVGMEVDGGEGHWVIGTELTHGFAQHLKSTPAAEDPSDWLWPHENDEGQWAENYGAGIRVHGAKDVHLVSLSGRSQQNGILLENTTDSVVQGCDFSFHSGWGLAMWRASGNRVERNSFDFCVRGFSNGVYERGQDSAGILMFEQCSRNVIRGNSATHSGDGLFLYAGHETTRKTGEGGSNDNLIEGNDFSFAVANGIEATFSTGNRMIGNRLEGCNYGVWAGYSRKTTIERNTIRDAIYAGVAIEHGSDNVIAENLFVDCRIAVRLWWDEDPDLLSSAYGKKNRTNSADTVIRGNRIEGGKVGLRIESSSNIRFVGNTVTGAEQNVATVGENPGFVEEAPAEEVHPEIVEWREETGARRGRRFMIVGEWGPYDFGAPLLNPVRSDGDRQAEFAILGLNAPVFLVESETRGTVQAEILFFPDRDPAVRVTPKEGATGLLPFRFVVETGKTRLTGTGSLLVTEWKVRFFDLGAVDPIADPDAFAALLAGEPALEKTVGKLDFPFASDGPGEPLGKDRFATLAEAEIALRAGKYRIATTSDDGIRVLLDGKEILRNWTRHAPAVDETVVEVKEGTHRFRVEHFELDGYARLAFEIRPVE